MTNPATPSPAPTPPASGGGMPKWLIIVLILLVVVLLICCGGVTTCAFVARRAARTGVQAAQRFQDQVMAATQRAADEEARLQAQQAAAAAGTTAPEPGGAAPVPTPGARGTPGAARPAVNLTGGLPSNFPKDLPVMTGFSSAGVSISDSAQGTGMVMLSGKAARQDAVAFYEKQMKDQGWTESNNLEIGESSTLVFTKDTRQATIQAITSDGNTMLTLRYEPKP